MMRLDDMRFILFQQIRDCCHQNIDSEWISTAKTIRGGTQKSEKMVVQKIREILNLLGLNYDEAGSQQSRDFRNVGGVGLDIEIKKTDCRTIYFNDTCPSKDIFYIIFFTGKILKKRKSFPPQLIFVNGSDFIRDSPWILDYMNKLELLRDEFARGPNKKQLPGLISVYPRPTYKGDISRFLIFSSETKHSSSFSRGGKYQVVVDLVGRSAEKKNDKP